MAQNEMEAKPALPERVRSMEGLGVAFDEQSHCDCVDVSSIDSHSVLLGTLICEPEPFIELESVDIVYSRLQFDTRDSRISCFGDARLQQPCSEALGTILFKHSHSKRAAMLECVVPAGLDIAPADDSFAIASHNLRNLVLNVLGYERADIFERRRLKEREVEPFLRHGVEAQTKRLSILFSDWRDREGHFVMSNV